MRVFVSSGNGEVLWWRDVDSPMGYTSDAYLRDGTQGRLIAALRAALTEAEAQLAAAESPAGLETESAVGNVVALRPGAGPSSRGP